MGYNEVTEIYERQQNKIEVPTLTLFVAYVAYFSKQHYLL